MIKPYHIEICELALGSFFSPRALKVIITANLAQDGLCGQIGHPEYHFDNNAFEAGNAYLESQRQIVCEVISNQSETILAWKAFGRMTHAVQDFYAHSNYIFLWVDSHSKCC